MRDFAASNLNLPPGIRWTTPRLSPVFFHKAHAGNTPRTAGAGAGVDRGGLGWAGAVQGARAGRGWAGASGWCRWLSQCGIKNRLQFSQIAFCLKLFKWPKECSDDDDGENEAEHEDSNCDDDNEYEDDDDGAGNNEDDEGDEDHEDDDDDEQDGNDDENDDHADKDGQW